AGAQSSENSPGYFYCSHFLFFLLCERHPYRTSGKRSKIQVRPIFYRDVDSFFKSSASSFLGLRQSGIFGTGLVYFCGTGDGICCNRIRNGNFFNTVFVCFVFKEKGKTKQKENEYQLSHRYYYCCGCFYYFFENHQSYLRWRKIFL